MDPPSQKDLPSSGILHIYSDLYITFLCSDQAERIAEHLLLGRYVLVHISAGIESKPSFTPSSLAEIFRFDEMLQITRRDNPNRKMILCTRDDTYLQKKTLFLTGCHLIMANNFTSQETSNTFEYLEDMLPKLENEAFTLYSCWTAISRAKSLGWIDFGNVFDVGDDAGRIFIEEYIHYAR